MSQLPIPDDWNPADGYMFMWCCVPNSLGWRSVARGAIYNLTRGRNWDGDTGTITEAQAIAREIYESLCMANCDDIVTQLTRIADAIEANNPQTITLDDATLQAMRDLITAWEAAAPTAPESLFKGIKDYLEMLTFLKALAPVGPGLIVAISDFIRMVMDMLYRRSDLRASWAVAMNGRIANLLNGGETLVKAGIELDDYMQIIDMQFGTDDWKRYIPGLGWLFDPTTADIDVDDVIKLLYAYFQRSNPDQPQAYSDVLVHLQAISAAVNKVDASTTVNVNNYNGCGCGECEDCLNGKNNGQVVSVNGNGLGCEEV